MNHKSLLCQAVALLCTGAVAAHAQNAGDSTGPAAPIRLAVAAQPIAAALNDFARQSGLHVVIGSDIAAGVKSTPVEGVFTPDAALDQLLRDTGLRYEYLDAQTVAVLGRKKTKTSAQDVAMTLRLAQATPPAPQSSVSSSTEAAGGSTAQGSLRNQENIQEVVVTARRREERLLDVPVSMAALGADEIQRRGALSSEDYLRGMPGVNQVATGYNTGQSIVIRGIETVPSAQNFGVGPTYASYFGETPTTSSAGVSGGTSVDIKVVDVERVEVLRGPQGTAFGDAALGGALRIIPAAPRLGVVEGRALAEYSDTAGGGGGNYGFQGWVNVPIGERVALRAVAYQMTESGFYRNRAGSSAAFQAGPVTQYSAQANAVDKDRIGDTEVRGARLAALVQATDNLSLTVNLLTQRNETDGVALANSGAFDQTLFQIDPAQVDRGQSWGYSDQRIDLVNPVLEYDLGWADLVATYSHTNSGSANAQAYGVFGLNLPISQGQPSDHDADVGELRVTTRLDGPINVVAGVFTEKLVDSADITFYWYGSAATSPYGGVRGLIGQSLIDRELKQSSAYGQIFWEMIDDLTLTAGARYYDYDRVFQDVRSGPLVGNTTFRGKVGASGTSPHANLSYKPTDNTMIYASYSEGFRLGTPQSVLPASRCDQNNDGLIDGTQTQLASTGALSTDEIKSYELGAKGSFLDGAASVDVAFFHMLWDGIPVRVLAPSPCDLSYQANAGNAESDGVELSASYRVTENLKINGGASWADAHLTEDVPALGARKGNQLPGAPKFNANLGISYDMELRGYPAFFRIDAINVGESFGNLLESPILRAKPYTRVDLSAGVTVSSVDVQLFVRNLTDEDAFVSRGTNAAIPVDYGYRLRPRTIGLRLGYRFGD